MSHISNDCFIEVGRHGQQRLSKRRLYTIKNVGERLILEGEADINADYTYNYSSKPPMSPPTENR